MGPSKTARGAPGIGSHIASPPAERRVLHYLAAVAIGLSIAFVVRSYVQPLPQDGPTPGDIAAASSGSAEAASAIPALAGFPNVTVAYYDIDAIDPAGIQAQLSHRGPKSHGRQFEAFTSWNYRWNWDAAPDGGCGTANATVTFEAHVALPRLAHLDSVRPEVARAWQSYINALASHEAGHVQLAYGRLSSIADAVRSSTCADANAAGNRVLQSIRQAEVRYDAATQHGRDQGVALRWQ